MEFVKRINEIQHYVDLVTNLKREIVSNDADKYQSKDNLHELIDSRGKSLLHYSVRMNDVTTTQWLLDYGLDVNAQTKEGETPLMNAAEDYNEDIVKILLKANAKIDLADSNGKTVLANLSFHSISETMIPGAMMMKLLEKCETDEEAATKLLDAKCPLYVVVLLKNTKITKFFLEKGIDVDTRMPVDRATALHVAVYFEDLKNAELLLNYDADVNATNYDGKTPLALMSSRYHELTDQLKILQLLLDRGAHLTTFTRDLDKRMQIYSILRFCSKEVVERVLQDKNIDVHAKDGHNNSLLHYMAGNNNPGVLELMKNQFIDVNAINDDGCTVLNTAALSGHKNTIQLLLDRGAHVNCYQDKRGMTPLCSALVRDSKCFHEDLECIELLIEYGAEIQIVSGKFKVDRGSIAHIIYGKDLTIIDLVANCGKHVDLIEPVLAHLAMLEATGTIIKKAIRNDINADTRFKILFNNYKNQLEQLKDIKIYDTVTMFQLLTMNQKQFLMHLRNEQLAFELEREDFKNNQNMYFRKLRLRIATAYRNQKLKILAAEALYQIMQLSYNTHPIITDKICSYLSKQDLLLLGQI